MKRSETPTVLHDEAAGRFVAVVDGLESECVYRRLGDVVLMTHTEVPPVLEGRGIAAALVAAALAWARSQGLKVRPMCSYVAAYLRRHPEDRDLMA
jgi:uncharacterized protein